MNTLQVILTIIVSLLGYPAGLVLAHFTREELKSGRIFFKTILAACVLGIILSLFFFQGTNLLISIEVIVFIFLLTLASFMESKSKK
jgi:hypothetical protein